jgi:hypothetical protein
MKFAEQNLGIRFLRLRKHNVSPLQTAPVNAVSEQACNLLFTVRVVNKGVGKRKSSEG